MNGGLTYRDMDERKNALTQIRRLEVWLKKEAIIFEVLTPQALAAIRTVLDGKP